MVDTAWQPLARALRDTAAAEWESLAQTVRLHSGNEALTALRTPDRAGNGTWHLSHIVEIFRLHAATTLRALCDNAPADHHPALHFETPPPSLPDAPAALRTLLADIDRFIAAIDSLTPAQRSRPIDYGRDMRLEDMLGIMSRHIVWHAAAAHYWITWRPT